MQEYLIKYNCKSVSQTKGSDSSLLVWNSLRVWLTGLCSKIKQSLCNRPYGIWQWEAFRGLNLLSVGVGIIECCLYVLLKLENFPVDLVMCYIRVSQIHSIRKIICCLLKIQAPKPESEFLEVRSIFFLPILWGFLRSGMFKKHWIMWRISWKISFLIIFLGALNVLPFGFLEHTVPWEHERGSSQWRV